MGHNKDEKSGELQIKVQRRTYYNNHTTHNGYTPSTHPNKASTLASDIDFMNEALTMAQESQI